MLVVFNKEKIYSYLISLGTVMILFVMAIAITNKNEKIIETSTNSIIANNIAQNEYNIDSKTSNTSEIPDNSSTNITSIKLPPLINIYSFTVEVIHFIL